MSIWKVKNGQTKQLKRRCHARVCLYFRLATRKNIVTPTKKNNVKPTLKKNQKFSTQIVYKHALELTWRHSHRLLIASSLLFGKKKKEKWSSCVCRSFLHWFSIVDWMSGRIASCASKTKQNIYSEMLET